MKVMFFNMGCVRDTAIMEYIKNNIKDLEIVRNIKELDTTDIIIFPTCAATFDTMQEEVAYLKYLMSNKNPNTKLIITGCFTDSLMDYDWLQEESVIFVNKRNYQMSILNIINNEHKNLTKKILVESSIIKRGQNNSFIQVDIEDGCTNKCSFCKTNYYKKKITSLPYDLLLNNLKEKIKNGTKIITLSGENITLYGIDLFNKPILHKFIHELTKEEGLEYLVVNEISPQNMYPELLQELTTNNKVVGVCMQLETASNRLLKDMNRNYTIEEYDYYVKELQKNNKLIETVLMNGFPGETYEDVDTTIKYIKDNNIMTSLICDYSDISIIPSHNLNRLNCVEQRAHLLKLKKEILKCNYLFYKKNMDNPLFASPIVLSHNNRETVLSNGYTSYSIKKGYLNKEIGTKVEGKPKMIVKEKDYELRFIYRY